MANIVDSYSDVTTEADVFMYSGNNQDFGQSFNSPIDCILSSCKFYIKKRGTISGNIYAKLYAHTGVYGVSGTATGSVLATSDAIDSSTLSTTVSLVGFTFSGAEKVSLTGGTKYVILLENTNSGDDNNCVTIYLDITSPTHGGLVVFSNDSVGFSPQNIYDTFFIVYRDDVSSASASLSPSASISYICVS